jgi:hypothetical protein
VCIHPQIALVRDATTTTLSRQRHNNDHARAKGELERACRDG